MIKLILTHLCCYLAVICYSQNDCWVKSTSLNDSYLKVIKIKDNKYLCSASNIWENAVKIHVYESEDLVSWEPTNIEFPSRFNVVFNKDSEGNLYAGTQNHGVYVSRDSGVTWEPKVAICSGCGSLAFEEDKNGVVYVGTGGLLKGYHVSIDKGENWIYPFEFTNIVDIESSTTTEYVYFTNINNVLIRSDNEGLTFQSIDDVNISNNTLFVRSINNEVFVFKTNGSIYKLSENEESSEFYSMIPINSSPRPYFNDIVVQADTWYVTIDNNGVYRSFDNGLTWELVNCNISGTVNYLFLDNFKIAATTTDGIYIIDECTGLIGDQPQTDTFELNSTAILSINAKVTPTSYQWQLFNGTDFENLVDSGQYSGTASNNLSINDISLDNQNQLYRCILTFGDCISISEEANLFVSETINTYSAWLDHKVSFSPNPATDILHVNSDFDENKKFEIFDINGVLVTKGVLNKKAVNIDISNIPAGMYIFSIEGGYSPLKFVKSN